MSVKQTFSTNYDQLKQQINNRLSAVSLDVESLLQIDVAQLTITKLLFQFIVAVIAVVATFTELTLYLGKNTFRTIFIGQ